MTANLQVQRLRMLYVVTLFFLAFLLFFLPITFRRKKKIFRTAKKLNENFTFSDSFLWGTATAAQQIESQNPTDWTAFEKQVLKEKKFESLAIGKPKAGHIHDLGSYPKEVIQKKTNYDVLFAKDLAVAKKHGHNSYRFSIDWARLFPKEDMKKPSPVGIAYYRNILKECKKLKLKPSVTLFHFATPEWLWQEKAGKRGWEREDALGHFSRFVEAVAQNFIEEVSHWCTLNEPMVYLYQGYIEGVFPPNEQRGEPVVIAPLVVELLKAHQQAYAILKSYALHKNLSIEVGFTQHTRRFEPLRNWHALDRLTAHLVEQVFQWDFCDALKTGTYRMTTTGFKEEIPNLKDSWDYLGINYYGRFYVRGNFLNPFRFQVLPNDPRNPKEEVSDLGWAIYPHGFYLILKEAYRRYHKPIYVLENGIADAQDNDVKRQKFLVEHIYEMALAMQEGVDIRGYYYWSLIDNFEWAEGFGPRFGLIKVDYKNKFQRTIRPSLKVYEKIINEKVVKI